MALDSERLEQGIQEQLPSLESFLKTILLKKINAEMSASSEADTAMVIEALKTGTAVIKCHDNAFDIDLFIAFDENWIPQLSMAMLGVEENELNEISRDLIKEFSSQLMGNIQTTLQEIELPFEPGDVELVKSGQITNTVEDSDYFMAQIDVSGKFEIEGDEQPHLAMIVTFEQPSDEKIAEITGDKEESSGQEAQAGEEQDDETADTEDEDTADEGEEEAGYDDEEQEEDADQPEEVEQKTSSEKASKKSTEAEPVRELAEERRSEAQKGQKVKGQKVDFEDFTTPKTEEESEVRNLELLKDVELDISVELGRRNLPLGDILHLVRGSVVELNKLAGEPVEIYANGHRIAEGEVVVIDEHFGVRITNLVSTKERIESLR